MHNVTTPNSGYDYGLKLQTQRLNQSAHELATQQPKPELTDHIATQISSKHAFTANIATLKTQDQTMGTLLDLIA